MARMSWLKLDSSWTTKALWAQSRRSAALTNLDNYFVWNLFVEFDSFDDAVLSILENKLPSIQQSQKGS